MKCLESIGLVDDITTGYAKDDVKEHWYGMYNQLLEFKQKHGHVKVPCKYNENKKIGRWVKEQRSNYREYKRTNIMKIKKLGIWVVKQRGKYREYKRTNGQKGDPEWTKRRP
eukprot:478605_1